ncbi:MAG: TIGR03564 family F420-dependent LLM class oxidoreductase [Chloroflexi bacterium]|nr:TIGR03564 family F420-dependent LLM class oxidoreductase [Chloroflexota bacterium]
MRLGLMSGGGDVAAQVQFAIDAEEQGFDTAWWGQIFGADAMTVAALAGARTKRIELATDVVPSYPRHPYVMAQQAMTVQAASQNRFMLGIGLSHAPVIEGMWGLSYEKPARHMKEYLSVLLPLVREGRVAHQGELYRTQAPLSVSGTNPPSVIIAALAPRMLHLAGSMCDGTVTWMTGPRTIETHVVPSITAAATEAGRPRPRVAVSLPVCVTDNAAEATEAAAKIFAMYGGLPNYRRMLDREGVAGPQDVAIVGDEASVERQIRAVGSAGATDFIAPEFPSGPDAAGSLARTRALLRSLAGKL